MSTIKKFTAASARKKEILCEAYRKDPRDAQQLHQLMQLIHEQTIIGYRGDVEAEKLAKTVLAQAHAAHIPAGTPMTNFLRMPRPEGPASSLN